MLSFLLEPKWHSLALKAHQSENQPSSVWIVQWESRLTRQQKARWENHWNQRQRVQLEFLHHQTLAVLLWTKVPKLVWVPDKPKCRLLFEILASWHTKSPELRLAKAMDRQFKWQQTRSRIFVEIFLNSHQKKSNQRKLQAWKVGKKRLPLATRMFS